MNKAVSNQPPVIYGDGNQSRDFVYVKDVVKALLLTANTRTLNGKSFNIGTGNQVRINRLWELIASISGRQLEPVYQAPRAGDILHSVGNIDMAESLLNFTTDFSLEQGLELTFEWYRGQMTD